MAGRFLWPFHGPLEAQQNFPIFVRWPFAPDRQDHRVGNDAVQMDADTRC